MKLWQKHKLTLILGAIFVLKVFVILAGVGDRGWEPDSYAHFNELATVYADFPNNLEIGLGVWAKPLYTYLFGLPVALLGGVAGLGGLWMVQVLNVAIFALISFLLFRIIKRVTESESLGIIAVLLLSLDFISLRASLSALTEPIFTLFLVSGVYLVLKQRYGWAGLVLGLAVLGRIEGLFFLGVFNLWLVWNNWQKLAEMKEPRLKLNKLSEILGVWVIGILPVFVWNFIGFLGTGKVLYIFQQGYPVSEQVYGTGGWFDLLATLGLHTTAIFGGFVVASIFLILKFRKISGEKFGKEIYLMWAMAAGFVLTQVITWRFGLFGSAGLARYFISVVPFLIICLFFIECLEVHSLRWRKQFKMLVNASLVALTGLVTIVHFLGLGPIDSKWLSGESMVYQTAGEWLKDNVKEGDFLASDRPEVVYYAGRNLENSKTLAASDFRQGKTGYYVWSESWGEIVGNLELSELEENANLVFSVGGTDEKVSIFELSE